MRGLLRARREDFTEVLARVTGRTGVGREGVRGPRRGRTAPAEAGARERRGAAGTARHGLPATPPGEPAQPRGEAAPGDRTRRADPTRPCRRRRREPPAPAQDPQLSGRDDWMVLNGAYLVDEDRGEEFAAAVDALRGQERRPGAHRALGALLLHRPGVRRSRPWRFPVTSDRRAGLRTGRRGPPSRRARGSRRPAGPAAGRRSRRQRRPRPLHRRHRPRADLPAGADHVRARGAASPTRETGMRRPEGVRP